MEELKEKTRNLLLDVRQEILDGKTEFDMQDWDSCIGGKLALHWRHAERNPLWKLWYWFTPISAARHGILARAIPGGVHNLLFNIGSWPREAKAELHYADLSYNSYRRGAAVAIDVYLRRANSTPEAPKQREVPTITITTSMGTVTTTVNEEEHELVGV